MAQSGLAAPWCTTATTALGTNAAFSQSAILFSGETSPHWPYGLLVWRSVAGAASANVGVSAWGIGGFDAASATNWRFAGPLVIAAAASATNTANATGLNAPIPPFWGILVSAQATGAASVTILAAAYVPVIP